MGLILIDQTKNSLSKEESRSETRHIQIKLVFADVTTYILNSKNVTPNIYIKNGSIKHSKNVGKNV